MNVNEIMNKIKEDFKMLDLVDYVPKRFKNFKEMDETIKTIFRNNQVIINRIKKKITIRGSVSDLVSNYVWKNNKSFIEVNSFKLVTYVYRLVDIGVPRSTIYRLIRNKKVKVEKEYIKDYFIYVIYTDTLIDPLSEVLESALKRSLKSKVVSERRQLALLRANELDIPYDYKLADDKYYEEIKQKLIQEAKELREKTDKLDLFNKIISYLIILNRYAKYVTHKREELYEIKEKYLKLMLSKVNAIRYLSHWNSYYDLWELEFKYNGYIKTHKNGYAVFHIPAPKIKGTDFESQLKEMCSEKGVREDYYYGRKPSFIERVAFPLNDVVKFLEDAYELVKNNLHE